MNSYTDGALHADHAEALRLLKLGDTKKATQKLTEASLQAPGDSRIPADLLRVLILEHQFEEAECLINSLPADLLQDQQLSNLSTHAELILASTPSDRDIPKLIMNHYMSLEESPEQPGKRLELASILLKIDDIESSLEQLYLIRQYDRGFRNDIGHRGMLALFAMLGEEDKLVEKYRLKLSSPAD